MRTNGFRKIGAAHRVVTAFAGLPDQAISTLRNPVAALYPLTFPGPKNKFGQFRILLPCVPVLPSSTFRHRYVSRTIVAEMVPVGARGNCAPPPERTLCAPR